MTIESLWIHLKSLYRYSHYIYNHLTKSIWRGSYSLNCIRKWLSGDTVSTSSVHWVSRWPYATRSECSRVWVRPMALCGVTSLFFHLYVFKTKQSWDLTFDLNLTAVTITLYFKWWQMGKWQLPELKNNDYAEVSKTAATPVATRGSKTLNLQIQQNNMFTAWYKERFSTK